MTEPKPQIMWAIPWLDCTIEDGAWIILPVKPQANTDNPFFARGLIDEDDAKRAVRVRVTVEPTNPRRKKAT